MRVICRYTGVELSISSVITSKDGNKSSHNKHFPKTVMKGEHPFFLLEAAELLDFIPLWAKREMDAQETRILFLALLNSTGLVDFKSTAYPSQKLIEQNMEALIKVIHWRSNINQALLNLPIFVISTKSGTHRLENISVWIERWNETRKDWYNRFESSKLAERLEHREEILDRLIRSPNKPISSYAARLADWAFTASGLPDISAADKETRERWLTIFRLKGWEIFQADSDDIYDLLTYMEANLEVHQGKIQAYAVLDHLRAIRDKNEHGLEAELGLIDGKTFEIIYDDIEIANRQAQAKNAPLVEPISSMIGTIYPTKVAYLNARAAWIAAEAEKERLENAAKKRKEEIATQDLAIRSEDEALIEAEEDEEEVISSLKIGDL